MIIALLSKVAKNSIVHKEGGKKSFSHFIEREITQKECEKNLYLGQVACPWWRIGVCQCGESSPLKTALLSTTTSKVKYADFRSWANLCWHPGLLLCQLLPRYKMQLTLLKDYCSHFAFCRWRRQICRSSETIFSLYSYLINVQSTKKIENRKFRQFLKIFFKNRG